MPDVFDLLAAGRSAVPDVFDLLAAGRSAVRPSPAPEQQQQGDIFDQVAEAIDSGAMTPPEPPGQKGGFWQEKIVAPIKEQFEDSAELAKSLRKPKWYDYLGGGPIKAGLAAIGMATSPGAPVWRTLENVFRTGLSSAAFTHPGSPEFATPKAIQRIQENVSRLGEFKEGERPTVGIPGGDLVADLASGLIPVGGGIKAAIRLARSARGARTARAVRVTQRLSDIEAESRGMTRLRLAGVPLEEATGAPAQQIADRAHAALDSLLTETAKITKAELSPISTGTYTKATREAKREILTSKKETLVSAELIRKAQETAAALKGELGVLLKKIATEGETAARPLAESYARRLNEFDERFRALRSEAGRSLHQLRQIAYEYKSLVEGVKNMGVVKARLPVIEEFRQIKQQQGFVTALKTVGLNDLVGYWVKNIFPVFSAVRDLATNVAVATSETAQTIAADIFDVFAGGKTDFNRSQALLAAVRRAGQKATPGVERLLEPTALGQKFQPIFSERLDKIIFLPAEMKRGVDTFFKRIGAMSALYEDALTKATSMGLTGQAKTDFVRRFVEEAPRKTLLKAVERAGKWGFNRKLSQFEESVSRNVWVKLLANPFPRWTFQFTRFAAEHTLASPEFWGKVRRGTMTGEDFARFLTRVLSGAGAVYAANELLYDNVDFKNMEYVREDGSRIKLTGLTPLPDVLAIAAVLRGDAENAVNALLASSLPFMGGSGEGILSRWFDLGRDTYTGTIQPDRLKKETIEILNDFIPGKGMLQALTQIIDPTVREGFTKDIPGAHLLATPKVDPTTGETARYKVRLPGMDKQISHFPHGFPGGARVTTPVEAELFKHGFGVRRPRRLPFIDVDDLGLGKETQKRYEHLAGRNVGLIVSRVIASPAYKNMDEESQRQILDSALRKARLFARQQVLKELRLSSRAVNKAVRRQRRERRVQTR